MNVRMLNPTATEIPCTTAAWVMPNSSNTGMSSLATNGSPTQPRARLVMVMPSWQEER